MGRILTEEDFERIRKLRHRKMVDAVMKKARSKECLKEGSPVGGSRGGGRGGAY